MTTTPPTVSNRADFFITKKIQLAAFILTTKQLEYLRAEAVDARKARFVFADPEHRGSAIELAFERDRATCCARDLFISQTFLRRESSAATDSLEFERSFNGERNGNDRP
jgi:hypothetical protein